MVILLMGPMGCGKTTVGKILARELDCPFVDGDDFHPDDNVVKMARGVPLSDDDRYPWLRTIRDYMLDMNRQDESCVVACSALKQHYREILGVDQKRIISVFLRGSKLLLQQRIEKRTHPYMSKQLLESQLETLEPPTDGITVDIDAPPDDIVRSIINQLKVYSEI